MAEILDFYKCTVCGNLVEIVFPGEGELVCCGQTIEKLLEKTEEMLAEKHIPVIEHKDGEMTVRVGSIPHPMEDSHYIMFIEVHSEDKKYVKRKYLHPHEEPVLKMKCDCDKVIARELCNIHGLWSSKKND
jgi:superoxide reductase